MLSATNPESRTTLCLESAYRKTILHLIPFIFICYIFNYLDRVNVGFAKLQMLDALGLSETVYGLGAGIFFVGYVLAGIPSNLILHKLGARRWIGVLMLVWGTLSASLMWVKTAESFYILRFFTGVAEAGFFPGMVLYFNHWFPSQRRGRILALFMTAVPLSGVIGGPLSGWMLNHFQAGQAGLAAWQWLYLLQGAPTVLLGLAVYLVLPEDFKSVSWLNAEEKQAMRNALSEDEASHRQATAVVHTFGSVLRLRSVWLLGTIYFCIQMGVYAINFWLPSIIKSLGFQNPATIGWLSAIPYLMACFFMLLVGRSADRLRERRWHLAVPMLMGFGGLLLATLAAEIPALAMLGLTLATMGTLTSLPMFWPLPNAYLSNAAAAGGLALINSLGQIAGFVSPYLVGWIKDFTGSTHIALYILAAVLCGGTAMVLSFPAKVVNR